MHAGSIPLSPLSYYYGIRSNVFSSTLPSNEGCTIIASTGIEDIIICGQGTTLIDCDRGFNGSDYSDLSNTFAWNRTTAVNQQVSIVFGFDRQINISRITMFFWNSPNNSIIVPTVRMFRSNDIDPLSLPNANDEINITTNSLSRTDHGQHRVNFDVNDELQYLKVVMSFYNNSEQVFLGEVQFCGEQLA